MGGNRLSLFSAGLNFRCRLGEMTDKQTCGVKGQAWGSAQQTGAIEVTRKAVSSGRDVLRGWGRVGGKSRGGTQQSRSQQSLGGNYLRGRKREARDH